MMKNKIIAANWKMNCSYEEAKNLLLLYNNIENIKNVDVIVCPPCVYFETAVNTLNNHTVKLGSQNISEYEKGAYTGEISANMLKMFKCEYAILGHSERRALFNESDKIIASKFIKAVEANIKPILCIGENEHERLTGVTDLVLSKQLAAIIDTVGVEKFKNSIIAYEPIWAIGTGKTPTTAMVSETSTFIHQFLLEEYPEVVNSVAILYGGSLNDKNAAELLHADHVDGGLIGGASLNYQQFLTICQSAQAA